MAKFARLLTRSVFEQSKVACGVFSVCENWAPGALGLAMASGGGGAVTGGKRLSVLVRL